MSKMLSFIGIGVPEPIQSRIRKFQRDIDVKYDVNKALKIPVHVTLIPPFYSNKNELQSLHILLSQLRNNWQPSKIVANGFGSFPPRVIYEHIEASPSLEFLRSELEDTLTENAFILPGKIDGKYTPHITIASTSLTKSLFAKAWMSFNLMKFHATWQNEGFVRYRHDGTQWKVGEEYPFLS